MNRFALFWAGFCDHVCAGDYLVSGSFAGHLYIWSVKDGTLVKSYQVEVHDIVQYIALALARRLVFARLSR